MNYIDPTGHWPEWLDAAVDFVDEVYGISDAIEACGDGGWDCAKAVGSSALKVAGTVAVAAAVVTLAPVAAAAGTALVSGSGLMGAAIVAETAIAASPFATEAAFVVAGAVTSAMFSSSEDAAGVVGDALEGAAVGQVTGWAATGKEFEIGDNLRIAPFGNRTGHQYGELPHYHRRIFDDSGNIAPGGGLKRHRPWEGW